MTTIITQVPARGVDNHSGGSYDRTAQMDLIETDPFHGVIQILSGTTDAIPSTKAGNYIINTGSADAMTLSAPPAGGPAAGGYDGIQIALYSNTAFAHTLTATGLLQTGGTATGVLTFPAHAGAGVILRAYGGFWQLIQNNLVVLTS
jgi:hypothetical protein